MKQVTLPYPKTPRDLFTITAEDEPVLVNGMSVILEHSTAAFMTDEIKTPEGVEIMFWVQMLRP